MKYRMEPKQDYFMADFPSYGENSYMKANKITIHDSAGMSSAKQEAQRLYNNSSQYNNGIAHYYVDENECHQLIADDKKAYHCGDGADYPGNGESIGIETCRSLSDKYTDFQSQADRDRYWKALYNAYKVAADLCDQYDISPDNIHQHREFSATACPYTQMVYWGSYENALKQAKSYVQEMLNGSNGNTSGNTNSGNSGQSNAKKWTQISWVEADRLTSTTNGTGTRIKKAKLSGAYPSDVNTFGHSKVDVNSSKVLFKELNEYEGYILDSTDGIVWFEITNIKGTNGEKIYLDLNKAGINYFYYVSTDNATILKIEK